MNSFGHPSQSFCSSLQNDCSNSSMKLFDSNKCGPKIVNHCGTPSMSRRRGACNGQVLNLHVEIPPITARDEISGNDITDNKLLTPSFMLFQHLNVNDNPCTPESQYHTAIPSPQAPRLVNYRGKRNTRWMPTPTEGVLPKWPENHTISPIASDITSPLATGSVTETSFMNSERSGIENTEMSRPKLADRALSWLSIPRRYESEDGDDTLQLASPLIVSSCKT